MADSHEDKSRHRTDILRKRGGHPHTVRNDFTACNIVLYWLQDEWIIYCFGCQF